MVGDSQPNGVHWGKKIMRFTVDAKRISLQGLNQDTVQCPPVTSRALKGLLNRQVVTHCIQLKIDDLQCVQDQNISGINTIFDSELNPKVEQLIVQFDDIFQAPSLPPPRSFDRTIPLIPRAQPVNIRAYRYSPAQKDEIEKQLSEML